MSNYKLLIFDLDDTLFDYQATEIQAISVACNSLGISYSDAIYSKYKEANNIAKTRVPSFIDNLPSFRKIRAELFLEALSYNTDKADVFIEKYLSSSTYGILIPGAEEVLLELSQVKKVIGTNGSTHPRIDKLKNSSIFSCFDEFYSSEIIGISKPNPQFFTTIAKLSNVEVSDCLYIGDNWHVDIEGAVSAGMDACYINSKNTITKISTDLATIFNIQNIQQLIEVVNEEIHRI